MSQTLILDVKGLYTYSSDIAGLPQGTLAVADNVNITRLNVLEPRRGFEYFYQSTPSVSILTFGSSSDRVSQFVFWKDEVFGQYGSSFAQFSPTSGTVSKGSLSKPANATSIKYVASSNKNLYLTGSTGLKKIDIVANNVFLAGIPKALSVNATVDTGSGGTAVENNKYVSYVYLLGRRDENGLYVYSSPSGRYTYQNTAGSTKDINVLCELPSGLDDTYFIQLYRTKGATTSATGEEYQLCFERFLSATNGKSFTIDAIERKTGFTKVTINEDLDLVTGQKVTVACVTDTSINGTFYIEIESGTPKTFSYQQSTALADITVTTLATGAVTTTGDTVSNQAFINDVTPDSLLGAYIYTAPSQEGILKANNYPPLASDIAEYQNCLFYADVALKHSLQIELISSTIYSGATITIGSEVYTAASERDFSTKTFKLARPRVKLSTVARAGSTVTITTLLPHGLFAGESVIISCVEHPTLNGTFTVATVTSATVFTYTGGTGSYATAADTGYIEHNNGVTSASVIRQNTAKDLIACINAQATGSYYASNISEDDLSFPGRILIEARDFSLAQFTVTSSYPDLWQPELNSPASPENTSDNSAFRNGLMYSKPQEHEHVPALNIFYVGNADKPIKRIKAQRDVLFIFKDDGTFLLRGETEANFTINQLDVNAKLYAPDSLVSVNNTIYGLFETGIGEVTDTGVSIISYPIKDQLFPLYSSYATNTKARAFAIANDTEGKYILSIPQDDTSAYTSKQIVFDVFSRLFCGVWYQTVTAGALNPADQKIYLAPNENRIKKEFRSFTAQDFVDEYQTISITSQSVDGLTLTLSSATNITVNDVLKQGSIYAYVTSVTENLNTVTVDTNEPWTLSSSTVIHYKAIDVHVEWNSDFSGNPAGLKHYYELVLMQKAAFLNTATFYFKSDLNAAESSITVAANGSTGIWGDFAWGEAPFGGDIYNTPVRCGIPRPHARCSQLRVRWEHQVAYSDFQVTGISLSFNPTSTRVVR